LPDIRHGLDPFDMRFACEDKFDCIAEAGGELLFLIIQFQRLRADARECADADKDFVRARLKD
jgi:hypothetical protein